MALNLLYYGDNLDVLRRHVKPESTDDAGRGNPGVKALSLMFSALAGGDSIDDAGLLRAGSTQGVLGLEVRAPSTLGTFLRSFTWGHALQLDAVSRRLLSRAWGAGAGPGAHPSPSTSTPPSARSCMPARPAASLTARWRRVS